MGRSSSYSSEDDGRGRPAGSDSSDKGKGDHDAAIARLDLLSRPPGLVVSYSRLPSAGGWAPALVVYGKSGKRYCKRRPGDRYTHRRGHRLHGDVAAHARTKPMIAVVLFGIGEQSGALAGRNTFPILGRPLMTYPLLAARYARKVDAVAISTNSPALAEVATSAGAAVILRPPELSVPTVNMGEVFRHAVETMETQTGKRIEMLVILLANAPAVTNDLIDRAITFL